MICAEPILGSFYEVDGSADTKRDKRRGGGSTGVGKVHVDGDCHERYREQTAETCAQCDTPILGNSYLVGATDAAEEEKKVRVRDYASNPHRELISRDGSDS